MDWLSLGYFGLFIVSFLSATVIPFSSDAIVGIMVGLNYDVLLVLLIASFGNTLGGMMNYYIGRLGKTEWIHKYLKISEKKIHKATSFVTKYSGLVALFTWLPGIGDALALTLGLFKVNAVRVWMFMLIGKTTRYALIIVLVKTGLSIF